MRLKKYYISTKANENSNFVPSIHIMPAWILDFETHGLGKLHLIRKHSRGSTRINPTGIRLCRT